MCYVQTLESARAVSDAQKPVVSALSALCISFLMPFLSSGGTDKESSVPRFGRE